MAGPLFDDSSLPPELDTRVRSELRDGEVLLWVGQPNPARFARQAIPLVLFGIPWTAFSVFWVAAASGMLFGGFANGPGGGALGIFACFPLFGLPFVLIGIGMLTSPYWFRRQAKQTFYALTDRRAILWQASTFGSVNVRSYGPEALGKMNRTEHADGSGDLVFEEIVTFGRNSKGGTTSSTTRHGFLAIADVRRIEELLRKALRPEGDKPWRA